MLINKTETLLVSSDPENGARNISSDGSYFEIQLDEPLEIPGNAANVTIEVADATVWWVVPNIVAGNNMMYITGPDINDIVQDYILTIDSGLYDLSRLNLTILSKLESAGAKVEPTPLITLSPDSATQRVVLRSHYPTVSIDFTKTDTPREILGFDSQVLGPYAITPVNILADKSAAFNQVNSFLLHSDLTNTGMRINNNYNQIIAQILIDKSPGSQLVSQPFNPTQISASHLTGVLKKRISIWLTDDKNRPVNTANEFFTARIIIRYSTFF